MEDFEVIEGNITSPKGFLASGVFAGIKKAKKDFALIYSEKKANAAALFTTNKVKAAPVLLDMEKIKNGEAQAIVANSGNANACTGQKGYEDACSMAFMAAEKLNIDKDDVLVCSTGVIGVTLPMDKIAKGIELAVQNLSRDGGKEAAEAILTTDTFTKEIAVKFNIKGVEVKIGGIAKGSGMISPNMATMLSFITTDADISKSALNKALKDTVKRSYNMISVDGDMSTNDTVIMLANGVAGNPTIDEGTKEYQVFYNALLYVNKHLAKQIAKDGEGATKFMEVNVVNAPTEDDAILASKSVVNSNLVKTAIFGEDANWGRIIAAVGYSGANFSQDSVDIYLKSNKGLIKVCENGGYVPFSEDKAKEILSEKEISIVVDFNAGKYEALAWGCDFSYDYVKINGSYRT
ncbi:bifunctional ornithine acetyltransferase/N-acetylglutamate synthase [Thermoanaerobacterium thermosaccharolyticum]|uniref:bifunctional ornithine acetyltransferase/N-acetylglutamate synthase n=1 Tax=Thermoanaerobacterium thermosaccharolyticum TaxID=1517 RepID=UPI001781FA61|nr:bifunctional ornithine acetyltransferase/N-acetylglutamate synthase [Thermoanaerobacterium thermosaccharolyticum]MBE0068713.1 bifunctional ornithine acetyltransferase/N-acetylglutamate synthase [Thermoanaerobacterium thermosaccharolyticum]MBE0228301.1 bifunctional ornithine acetyltransferase/N-acetylglutamate synthase [Thermoanaerobacterium thermosaccharolyticum]